MAQSTLYKIGSSSVVSTVDVTNDAQREIGIVTVSALNDTVDVSDRADRTLGRAVVTNTIDANVTNLPEPVDVSGATVSVQEDTPLDVSGATVTVDDPALDNESNLSYGQDTVSTSGTAVALNGGTSQTVPDGKAVSIAANSGNAGSVYVGDSSVGTASGRELQPGGDISLAVSDVASIYVDADNGGDGVSWIVEVAA